MSCRELVDLVTAYIEGQLSVRDRERFEAHLAVCTHCATYLAQMRQTIASLGELREESLSAKERESLLAAFRGWRRAV